MKVSGVILCFCGVFVFNSCASVKIKPETSAAEIVQMGQSAMDRDKYKEAILCYEILKERMSGENYLNYPADSALPEQRRNDYVCEALYEIAFLHYKQKKYKLAGEGFDDLMAMYGRREGESAAELLGRYGSGNNEKLPRKFIVLANIVLKKIAQKPGLNADRRE